MGVAKQHWKRNGIICLVSVAVKPPYHVLPDEIARARIALENLLLENLAPKEIDAALLSVIGFPVYS